MEAEHSGRTKQQVAATFLVSCNIIKIGTASARRCGCSFSLSEGEAVLLRWVTVEPVACHRSTRGGSGCSGYLAWRSQRWSRNRLAVCVQLLCQLQLCNFQPERCLSFLRASSSSSPSDGLVLAADVRGILGLVSGCGRRSDHLREGLLRCCRALEERRFRKVQRAKFISSVGGPLQPFLI